MFAPQSHWIFLWMIFTKSYWHGPTFTSVRWILRKHITTLCCIRKTSGEQNIKDASLVIYFLNYCSVRSIERKQRPMTQRHWRYIVFFFMGGSSFQYCLENKVYQTLLTASFLQIQKSKAQRKSAKQKVVDSERDRFWLL